MLSPEKSKSASKSKNQQATGQAESTSFGISGQAARHSPGCSGHGLLIRDSLGSGLGHRHSVALAHPTSGAANVCHLWDLIPPQVRPWADFLGLVPKIPRVGPNWGGGMPAGDLLSINAHSKSLEPSRENALFVSLAFCGCKGQGGGELQAHQLG